MNEEADDLVRYFFLELLAGLFRDFFGRDPLLMLLCYVIEAPIRKLGERRFVRV